MLWISHMPSLLQYGIVLIFSTSTYGEKNKSHRETVRNSCNLIYNYYCQDNNGTIEDHSESQSLSDDDINGLGSLRCGLTRVHASRLTEEALQNNMADLANCTFDKYTGNALMDNAHTKIRQGHINKYIVYCIIYFDCVLYLL